MSTEIQFPNTRKKYTGVGNPLYITDVVNLTENLLIAMKNVLGLGDSDFAIVSGFTYTPGSPGSYSSGVCYMNGVFYYFDGSSTPLAENKYLAPNVTDSLSKVYQDTVSRYTYSVNYAVSSNTPVGGMPQFTGTMDAYRLNVKSSLLIANALSELVSVAATARNNLSVYSKAYIDSLFTDIALKRVVVTLGDWNMDADANYGGSELLWATLALDYTKVRRVTCLIRADADVAFHPVFPLDSAYPSGTPGGYVTFGSGGVNLGRVSGANFDSSNFDSTSYSRGWVIIEYV